MSQSDRPLTSMEKAILQELLEADFPGKNELLLQIREVFATPTGDPDNYGSIYLKTLSKSIAPVTNRIPVEAEVNDEDGIPIAILLHVVDGSINELEILKGDGTPVKRLNPRKLRVKVNHN